MRDLCKCARALVHVPCLLQKTSHGYGFPPPALAPVLYVSSLAPPSRIGASRCCLPRFRIRRIVHQSSSLANSQTVPPIVAVLERSRGPLDWRRSAAIGSTRRMEGSPLQIGATMEQLEEAARTTVCGFLIGLVLYCFLAVEN